MLVSSVLMDQLRRHGSPDQPGGEKGRVMAEDFPKYNRHKQTPAAPPRAREFRNP
jgi:hypothetical protein